LPRLEIRARWKDERLARWRFISCGLHGHKVMICQDLRTNVPDLTNEAHRVYQTPKDRETIKTEEKRREEKNRREERNPDGIRRSNDRSLARAPASVPWQGHYNRNVPVADVPIVEFYADQSCDTNAI
jgi:hypothetical protein